MSKEGDDEGASGGVALVMEGAETPCDGAQALEFAALTSPLAKMASEEPPVAKISMPGISNIFGHANRTRRIVWTLVVVAAISIATIQVSGTGHYPLLHSFYISRRNVLRAFSLRSIY